MNIEAVNAAIKGTKLDGRLTAEDMERWRRINLAGPDSRPLWLSVLICMGASLFMKPSEIDKIIQAAMPDKIPQSALKEAIQVDIINPDFITEMSLAADAALRRGETEESQSLWLKLLQAALEARMVPAEPYRLFGNVASAAYFNGNHLLGDAAVEVALRLNPQYSFGQKLQLQALRGDFLQYSLRKFAESSPVHVVSSKDLVAIPTEQILIELSHMGIKLNETAFEAIGRPVVDSLETVVRKVEALASDPKQVDDDYLYAACEVLWERLITRPLMETFISIVFDLEDVEPDSRLYFSTIERLALAFEQADSAVFKKYQKYPHEFASLRAVVHELLAFEVLRQSNVAEHMFTIAEAGLASGYCPDFAVADVVRRIDSGKNWQFQLEQLQKRLPEDSQMIAMGVARGLLEIDEYYKAIGVCCTVWDKVLAEEIEPDEWPFQFLENILLTAYEKLDDKRGFKQTQKEAQQIDRFIESKRLSDANERRKAKNKSTTEVLKQDNIYPELYNYEEFVFSLGLDFSTLEPTSDKLSAYSLQTGQKIGRNEPCPCGGGKKYKKCHGANL